MECSEGEEKGGEIKSFFFMPGHKAQLGALFFLYPGKLANAACASHDFSRFFFIVLGRACLQINPCPHENRDTRVPLPEVEVEAVVAAAAAAAAAGIPLLTLLFNSPRR